MSDDILLDNWGYFSIFSVAVLVLTGSWTAFFCYLVVRPDDYRYIKPLMAVLLSLVGFCILDLHAYTLAKTHGWRRWDNLTGRDKDIAVVSLTVGSAEILYTCGFCCFLQIVSETLHFK